MGKANRRQFLGSSLTAAAAMGVAGKNQATTLDSTPVPPCGLTIQRWPDYRLLFFDLKELASVKNLKRIIQPGQKHPSNPVLPLGTTDEWDHAQAYNYGRVYYDEPTKKFRNWYVGTDGRSWRGSGRIRYRMGYAESADGLAWHKPKLGLFEYEGSKNNNIVWPDHVNAYLIDDEEPDANRRFKMCTWDGTGLSMGYSPDGLHWKLADEQAWGWPGSKTPGDPDQHMTIEARCLLRDNLESDPARRFKMYGQITFGGSYHAPGLRLFGMVYSADGEKWRKDPNNPLMDPADGAEDEIHIADVWIYEGWYLCMYEYTWYHPKTGFFSCDIRLAVSRDGVHFERIQNDISLVPVGPPGTWDSGMVMTSNAPIILNDEILFYYSANDDKFNYYDRYGPDESCGRDPRRTGLVKWRLDGLTCLRVSPRQTGDLGEFITHPIELRGIGGQTLLANADGLDAESNAVRAEVQGADGKPLPGYSLEECTPITDSGASQAFHWKDRTNLASINDSQVRLRVEMTGRNSRLYSVRIG